MTWEEYYEKFYDWANSTQISRISKLTSFGSADEISEVAIELSNEAAATRLIKKAVTSGVVFSAGQIIELMDALGADGMNYIVSESKCSYSREQLDEISCVVSDSVFEMAAQKSNIDFYGDDVDNTDDTLVDDDLLDEDEPPAKLGFFSKLALAFGVASEVNNKVENIMVAVMAIVLIALRITAIGMDAGIMGHHHQRGCEFGGNKGL